VRVNSIQHSEQKLVDFTYEQSLEVAIYFGLDEKSTEYFSLLVQLARAGTKRLEDHLKKKLEKLRADALDFKNRVPEHEKLSEQDMAVFYSNWFYSGVRLLTSIKEFDNVEAISNYFKLNRTITPTPNGSFLLRFFCFIFSPS
jgi:hypothetical protein